MPPTAVQLNGRRPRGIGSADVPAILRHLAACCPRTHVVHFDIYSYDTLPGARMRRRDFTPVGVRDNTSAGRRSGSIALIGSYDANIKFQLNESRLSVTARTLTRL